MKQLSLNRANQILFHMSSDSLNNEFRLITRREDGKLVIRAQLRNLGTKRWQNRSCIHSGYELPPTTSLDEAMQQLTDVLYGCMSFFITEGDWQDGKELTIERRLRKW